MNADLKNRSPFSKGQEPQPLMDDLELIELLLECPYVEDQLEVGDDHIAADVRTNPLPFEFFLAMTETGRNYSVDFEQVRFDRTPQMKIAK